jgi:uncharacterized lipoprotein YmbA
MKTFFETKRPARIFAEGSVRTVGGVPSPRMEGARPNAASNRNASSDFPTFRSPVIDRRCFQSVTGFFTPLRMTRIENGDFRIPSGMLFAGAVVALLFAGCNIIPPPSADPTRYYVLTGPALTAPSAQPVAGAFKLGLHNVELAPYLKKGTLVVRTGDYEVSFPNDARWGVPLEQEITRTLRSALLAAPTVGRVFLQPFPFDGGRDYDVSVQVLRCEGVMEPGAKTTSARFAAAIEITTAGASPQVVARKMFVAPDAGWDGKDFAQLAAQLSLAVNALGQEVVASFPEKK